jgi:predicted MPP superfamily phosphohydrolase
VNRFLPFLLFLAIALAVLGGMHGYLWLRLVRDPLLTDPWRRLATWGLLAAGLLIPVGLFSARLSGRHLSKAIPLVAFVWLGMAFLLFAVLLAVDAVRLLGWSASVATHWLRGGADLPDDPARRLLVARAVAGGALLVAGVSTVASIRSATGPAEIEEVPVKLARLPPALSGFTLAQISDLHIGPTIREREVRRMVEQVNALRPDAVAITGDLVDGSTDELGAIVVELGHLQARHGVYFVTGNHEYYSGAESWMTFLTSLGIRVLRNERVALGDGTPRGATFDLAGVPDWSAGHGSGQEGLDLPRALAGRDPERSLVLLAHQPRDFGPTFRQGVELQLSGHTHGGQLFPWSLAVRAAFPYVKGLHRHEQDGVSGQVYVSRGTGYWGPPMRLGSSPEITKLVLTAS